MRQIWHRIPKVMLFSLVMALLLIIIACGSASDPTQQAAPTTAPTTAATVAAVPSTPAPQAAAPTAAPTTGAAVPTVAPEATTAPVPAKVAGPHGTLNIGYQENLGVFNSHPKLTGGNYALFVGTSIAETLIGVLGPETDYAFRPELAKEWSLSPDNLVWTFKLQEGVQFHKGYGEMTADDIIWTFEQSTAEGSRSGRKSQYTRLWANEKGYVNKIDDHTIEVHTGVPQYDMLHMVSIPSAGFIMNKKQADELGEEAASHNGAGTGPWEFMEARTGEFWRFEAVEDHWRKTPNFAEMVFHDIPEGSTRLANFQTGKLDTFVMQLDSKAVVDDVPGVKYMRIVGGGNEQIGWFGNFYGGHGTPEHKEKYPGYDPDLPWVSSNPDINSEEWARARKVRLAMSIAIDRQLIVDTILKGEGAPTILWGWEEAEHRLPPDLQKGWEYNPERAKQLLAEAGYPDGFEVTLVPSIRGVPGEVDACFAAATMWEDIGIRTKQQKILYTTHRLTIIERSFNQVNCHGGGGRVDPLTLHPIVNYSGGTWSAGMSHPVLDELIDKAILTIDDEERWKASGEVARFLFENVGSAGLYKVNIIWPLGTRIDTWIEHLDWGDRRILNSTEYTPHRK